MPRCTTHDCTNLIADRANIRLCADCRRAANTPAPVPPRTGTRIARIAYPSSTSETQYAAISLPAEPWRVEA